MTSLIFLNNNVEQKVAEASTYNQSVSIEISYIFLFLPDPCLLNFSTKLIISFAQNILHTIFFISSVFLSFFFHFLVTILLSFLVTFIFSNIFPSQNFFVPNDSLDFSHDECSTLVPRRVLCPYATEEKSWGKFDYGSSIPP